MDLYYFGTIGGTSTSWWENEGEPVRSPSRHGIPWDWPPREAYPGNPEDAFEVQKNGDARAYVESTRRGDWTVIAYWTAAVSGANGTAAFIAKGAGGDLEAVEAEMADQFPGVLAARDEPIHVVETGDGVDGDWNGYRIEPLDEKPSGDSGPTIELGMLEDAERRGLKNEHPDYGVETEVVEEVVEEAAREVLDWDAYHVEATKNDDGVLDIRLGPWWGLSQSVVREGRFVAEPDAVIEDLVERAAEDWAEHARRATLRWEAAGRPEPSSDPAPSEGESSDEAPSDLGGVDQGIVVEGDEPGAAPDDDPEPDPPASADGSEDTDDEPMLACPHCSTPQDPPLPDWWGEDGREQVTIPCTECGRQYVLSEQGGVSVPSGDMLLED